jgi:predicted Na+-dependent transporter
MILALQGWLVALVFVNLVLAVLLGLLFTTWLARRLKVSDILRTGE